MHLTTKIETLEQLRALIPAYNPILDRRILGELDDICREFVERATFVVFSRTPGDIHPDESAFEVLPVTGAENRLVSMTDTGVKLQLDRLAHSYRTREGNGSLYFLAAGLGHGLRVNGHYRIDDDSDSPTLSFSVAGAYLQCARAATRADLWKRAQQDTEPKPPEPKSDAALKTLLDGLPFAVLHTCNAAGVTEASPRGDAQGLLIDLGRNQVFLPERPGNKVAVSLRNLLESPTVALCLPAPGTSTWLEIRGTGSIRTDTEWLDLSTLQGKKPKLGILISIEHWQLYKGALPAEVWVPPAKPDPITPFSKGLAEHMQGKGIKGKLTHLVVAGVVKKDMKNLY